MPSNADAVTQTDRIERMFKGDKWAVIVLLAALWATTFFVLFSMRGFLPSAQSTFLCWAGAVALLVFNTVAMIAMVKHYGGDKTRIYSLDIHHLDRLKGRQ